MPLVKLLINQIEIDTELQCREKQDVDAIAEYATAYKANAKIPPIIVFNDGKARWCADGFHRYGGAKQAQLKHLTVDERRGTKRDALLFAVGANAEHGLRRTNADKRKAVSIILADDEWSQWPAQEIARRCQVTHTFVLAMKKEKTGVPVAEVIKILDAADKREKKGGGSKAESAPPVNLSTVVQTPAADIPDDAFDEPEPIADAQLAHDAHNPTRDIANRIHAIIRDWEAIGQDCHPFISQQAVSAYLKNAVADIRLGQPFAVCPYCSGQKCAACKGTGWVTKSILENAPNKNNAITL